MVYPPKERDIRFPFYLYQCCAYNNFIHMKGSLYANPTFINRRIQRPTVVLTKPLVAYDQSRLYLNNISIKWNAKDIVNCTFSNNYRVLLVLSDNSKIYVFNEQLELITHLSNWQSKYIVGFELIQPFNQFLLIGTTEVDVIKVNIITNVKKTKFLSSMKFNIKKEVHLTVQPENKLKWNKGYGYITQQDLLFIWSLQEIYFYSLQKLTIRNKAVNITKKELAITTVYFSNYFKYTIGGLMNGQIKVWRISINPLFVQKEILIHNFANHSKQIVQIIQGDTQKNIITLGLDLNVCFLSIQTFQALRIFNFVGQYTKIYLFDHIFAYAVKEGYLGELNYGKNLEFITQLTGTPISYGRQDLKIQMTLNSNICIELDLQELNQTSDLNKLELIYLYPPLKSKNITQVLSCPFAPNSYFMLVQDGDIFHVTLQGTKGKIDQHYVISKLSDTQGHQFHQVATKISFLEIAPPQVDTELIERVVDQRYRLSSKSNKETQLLTIGCNKGSIIFVPISNMDQIYARITYHREQIVNFQEIHNKSLGLTWLVSICQQHYMKIISFDGGRANCIHTIFFGDNHVRIYGFQLYLALVFQKGIFQIARFTPQPTIILNRDCINHQDEVVALNYRSDLQLILTGGKDNKIKIWTTFKIQIYEIVLDEALAFCMWGNNMNIVLIQNLKLCCIRNIPLQITLQEVVTINQQFEIAYSLEDEYALSRYIQEHLFKSKERKFKIRPVRHQTWLESPKVTTNIRQEMQFPSTTQRKAIRSLGRSGGNLSDRASFKSPTRKAFKTQESEFSSEKVKQQNDHQAVRKHLQEMSSLKKETNKYNLPKMPKKNEDIFVSFMRERLLNKRLLTRRDITLNRIILKNIIKDHVRPETDHLQSVRLQ